MIGINPPCVAACCSPVCAAACWCLCCEFAPVWEEREAVEVAEVGAVGCWLSRMAAAAVIFSFSACRKLDMKPWLMVPPSGGG